MLPKLLLHETHLVRLELWKISRFGYISPEAIVTGLAVLANFESLTIRFEFFPSLQNQEIRSPLPNAHRPSLSYFFWSKGDSEYLEDLLVWVDAPLLDSIWIKIFHQLKFVIPQLAHFMRRTTRFQPLNFNEAGVDFDTFGVQVKLLSPTQNLNERSVLRISCQELGPQISAVAQVFTSFIPSIYMVKHLTFSALYVCHHVSKMSS